MVLIRVLMLKPDEWKELSFLFLLAHSENQLPEETNIFPSYFADPLLTPRLTIRNTPL